MQVNEQDNEQENVEASEQDNTPAGPNYLPEPVSMPGTAPTLTPDEKSKENQENNPGELKETEKMGKQEKTEGQITPKQNKEKPKQKQKPNKPETNNPKDLPKDSPKDSPENSPKESPEKSPKNTSPKPEVEQENTAPKTPMEEISKMMKGVS